MSPVILWTVDSKYSENKKDYRVRTYAHVRKEFLKNYCFYCPVSCDSHL